MSLPLFITPEVEALKMPDIALEKRVAAVEQQIAKILAQQASGSGQKNWQRTVGMFTDDPGMREHFAEAQRIREGDRKKAKRKRVEKRRVQS
jgi:hypothetical protein